MLFLSAVKPQYEEPCGETTSFPETQYPFSQNSQRLPFLPELALPQVLESFATKSVVISFPSPAPKLAAPATTSTKAQIILKFMF
jgi:hypothetical protein